MSFALTKSAVIGQRKTITRRQGWANLKVGELIQPIEKGMGLKKGQKQKTLGCPIRILSIRQEPIEAIDQADVLLEGFFNMTPEEFISMYCKANRVLPSEYCRRIEYEYTEALPVSEAAYREYQEDEDWGITETIDECDSEFNLGLKYL